jgi:hypothetical protein
MKYLYLLTWTLLVLMTSSVFAVTPQETTCRIKNVTCTAYGAGVLKPYNQPYEYWAYAVIDRSSGFTIDKVCYSTPELASNAIEKLIKSGECSLSAQVQKTAATVSRVGSSKDKGRENHFCRVDHQYCDVMGLFAFNGYSIVNFKIPETVSSCLLTEDAANDEISRFVKLGMCD